MITYHPRAKTNLHLRGIIKESSEGSRVLAERFGINPKTILKWRKRDSLTDLPYGAKTHHFVLTSLEQKIITKVRKHLKLNLDDLVIILKPYIPKINRYNAYRVLVRHQLNRLPNPFRDQGKGRFGYYLPGFIHIDLAYLPILKGYFKRKYLLVSIDRITKIVFVMIANGKTQNEAVRFLNAVIKFYPYTIHRILTDNGKEFGRQFGLECQKQAIVHKRTKVKHPWTNGQAEITIQRIKKDTVWKIYYQTYDQLKIDLTKWQNSYNLGGKLKSLKYLTPYQKVLEYYQSLSEQKQKARFKKIPNQELITVPLYGAT